MSLHVLSYDMKRAMNILSLPGLLQCDAGRLKPEDSLLAGAGNAAPGSRARHDGEPPPPA